MKEFALVYCNVLISNPSHSGKFLVMEYADWARYPIGCVMQTSDDEIELIREANWRNQN